ncbi:malate dehydrogenase [Brevibacterium paucivorans]|uniref:malate dehydrogenase n=1 Tax=Brevibacterium paucivorans TaxID=170994 RepID=UPI00321A1AB7
MKIVAVSGAAGNIGYNVLGRLADGYVYRDEPIELRLLEVPQAVQALDGVIMELVDHASPRIANIVATDDPEVAFDGAHAALLIGSAPRKDGMTRGDLLEVNAGIFATQGRVLGQVAHPDCKVVVTGNPANTNALVAAHHAEKEGFNPANITALTRLDHNRLIGQLAQRARVRAGEIAQVAVWGNHSNTQFPDLTFATVSGAPALDVIDRETWLDTIVPTVATRGGAVIKARGGSSVVSAASATLDHLRDWEQGTDGRWVSMAVPTQTLPEDARYGVPAGVVYSYPVTIENGTYTVVPQLELTDLQRERITASANELLDERSTAAGKGHLD